MRMGASGRNLDQYRGSGGFAAFGDGPDDQRLAAAHVAGGEDAGDGGHVVGVGSNVAAAVERHAQLLDGAVLRGSGEAHGEQDKVGVEGEFGAGDGREIGRRADADGVQLS